MKSKLGCCLILALLSSIPARADLILSVDSVAAAQGSTGNGLNVTLTNTGPLAITIGGFNFTISTADTDITFISTDIFTTPVYVLAGDSLFGPVINLLSPGQTMDGSDVSSSGLGDAVAAGATVGLGRVLFDVSPTAVPGGFAVLLATDIASTSVTDALGSPITIDQFNNGDIRITGSVAVPEPGTVLLLGVGVAAVLIKRKEIRRRTAVR